MPVGNDAWALPIEDWPRRIADGQFIYLLAMIYCQHLTGRTPESYTMVRHGRLIACPTPNNAQAICAALVKNGWIAMTRTARTVRGSMIRINDHAKAIIQYLPIRGGHAFGVNTRENREVLIAKIRAQGLFMADRE